MRTISVDEFSRNMRTQNQTILDVRTEEEYQAGRIEGPRISGTHILAEDIMRDPAALAPLDKSARWLLVSTRGVAAKDVGGVMDQAGYQSTLLEGGIEAWNNYHQRRTVAETASWTLEQVQRPGKRALSYILTSQGEAMIFDPSQFPDTYRYSLMAKGMRLKAVCDTRVHADHITGAYLLSEMAGAPYYRGAAGEGIVLLEDGQQFSVGAVKVEAWTSPGIAPDAYMFLIGGRYLLSGDTLYISGPGKPGDQGALAAGDFYQSLQKILALPDSTVILPAHYRSWTDEDLRGIVSCTLEDLLKKIPQLKAPRDEFLAQLASAPSPALFLGSPGIEAFNRNRQGGLEPDDLRALEISVGQPELSEPV